MIYCKAGERKHLIAGEYLASHEVGTGVFLVLAAKAPAGVWEVRRSASTGVIGNIAKKAAYVNHYSFHIMDPWWGHVTIKMSGHPPFPAQVILNGHEYVAAVAQAAGIGFAKEGNCFTGIADPQRLAQVADTLPQSAAIGRLGQVCDRWIYSACLCSGLDLAGQARSGFAYSYSIYQAEYSRNRLFRSGGQMEDLFHRICDQARSRLDIPGAADHLRAEEPAPPEPGRRPARAGNRDREIPVRPDLVHGGLRAPAVQSLHQGASTSCVPGPPCTTPKSCAAAVAWRTFPRSSPGWPAWPAGSPPPSTAPTSAS